jgi:vacuolar protein sorting-associated protein IST1
MKKIATNMPSAELVEGYLAEIARGYGVQWNTGPVGDGQHGDAQGLVVSGLAILQQSLWGR